MDDEQPQINMKRFNGPGFALAIPTDWYTTSTPELQAIFVSPTAENGRRASLTVSIRLLEDDADLQTLAATVDNTRAQTHDSYERIAEEDYTESGGSGFQHYYRWFSPENNSAVYQLQTFFLAGNVLFTLTGSMPEGLQQDYLQLLILITNSFRIKAETP